MSGPVAVIPARNEAARLPAALAALARDGVRVIVVANGCTDATAPVARAQGAEVIETPALPGGAGAARGIGLEAALRMGAGWLLTTDADGVVVPGAIDALRRALLRADAAFGRAVLDPDELARLPDAVRRHAALAERRDALRALIEGHGAADPWNPFPCHGQDEGTLAAWRPAAYRAAGGLPPAPAGAGPRMAAALARAGRRVARPWAAAVLTSCRLDGRIPGGRADRLAAWARRDLGAGTAALARDCAALEADLAARVPVADWPLPPTPPPLCQAAE